MRDDDNGTASNRTVLREPASNQVPLRRLEAPPLGLVPQHIHKWQVARKRLDNIHDAMLRYAEAGKCPPLLWFGEIRTLTDEIDFLWRTPSARLEALE